MITINNNAIRCLTVVLAILIGTTIFGAPSAMSDIISTPKSSNPLARGMSFVVVKKGLGMITGMATINTKTGVISYQCGLETDRIDSGPKGTWQIVIYDAAGKELKLIGLGELSCGGTLPGKPRFNVWKGEAKISPAIAAKAKSIEMTGRYTGQLKQLYSLGW